MTKIKHTFYCPDFDSGFLGNDESGHAVRVLRLKVGDFIRIINGKGNWAEAKITATSKKQVDFEIINRHESEKTALNLHIAIAPTKSFDRFSFFLEKVTEMGCGTITPIFTSNSERKHLRFDKCTKVMIAALKQSGNLFLPKLNEPLKLEELINEELQDDLKLIAHCDDDKNRTELKDLLKKGNKVLILIGPEGDFTPEEVILAKAKGFKGISLGDARLRTETAGIVACHTAFLYL